MRTLRFIILFPTLIVFIGVPLWIKGLLTGSQEGRLMDFFCWLLGED